MLTAEENGRLTRIGPGTPAGELFRRYWHPVAASAQLDENPVRAVRLLGEDLTLYKDKRGRLSLIADRCAHRHVKLVYGIPEEDGLRLLLSWLALRPDRAMYRAAGRARRQQVQGQDSYQGVPCRGACGDGVRLSGAGASAIAAEVGPVDLGGQPASVPPYDDCTE